MTATVAPATDFTTAELMVTLAVPRVRAAGAIADTMRALLGFAREDLVDRPAKL